MLNICIACPHVVGSPMQIFHLEDRWLISKFFHNKCKDDVGMAAQLFDRSASISYLLYEHNTCMVLVNAHDIHSILDAFSARH